VGVGKAAEHGGMKTTSRTRPGNVTPFVLEGRWALDRLDQATMRWLSKVAKRKRVGSPMSSTKLSSHSSRNAKLRPNWKRKSSRSDVVREKGFLAGDCSRLLAISSLDDEALGADRRQT
jgi:hypothetical protein